MRPSYVTIQPGEPNLFDRNDAVTNNWLKVDLIGTALLTISEPPILEPVALHPDLGFEMTLTSRGGSSYGVDASTNLKQWTQALAMHEVNGSVQVVDELAIRRDYSFYQAVEIPRSGSGLVTWWAGDGNALDQQGNFHGQRQGNVTYLPGVFGRAFNFDGDSTYVETHGQAVFSNVDHWSFDCWVYWMGLSDREGKRSQTVFAVGLAGNDGYGMTVAERSWCESNPEQCGDVGHVVVFYGGKQYVQPGGAMLPEQEWAHLALTRSSGYLRLYINGTPVFSTQTDDPYPPTGNTHISAGSGYAFNGLIDEARFWNRALSGREIRDIHRVGALELAKRPW